MNAHLRKGRIAAALLLVQMAGSAIVNFVLAAPLFEPAGFLETAAPHATQIALSALLGIALGGVWLGIAVVVFPLVRCQSEPLALILIGLSVVCLATSVVEHMNVMSMLSLSEAYARAPVAQHESFQFLRAAVAASRNWAHFTALLLTGSVTFAFYATLLRLSLVPRALALLGIAAALSQIASVAMPYFGRAVVFPMLAPLGVAHLLLAVWLIAKGFSGGYNTV